MGMSEEYNMQEWYCSHCDMMHITQHLGMNKAHCPQCNKQMVLNYDLNARRDCYSDHIEWHLTEAIK